MKKKSNRFPGIEWWEMLDWNTMPTTWKNLPEEIKDKIKVKGLAPKGDDDK